MDDWDSKGQQPSHFQEYCCVRWRSEGQQPSHFQESCCDLWRDTGARDERSQLVEGCGFIILLLLQAAAPELCLGWAPILLLLRSPSVLCLKRANFYYYWSDEVQVSERKMVRMRGRWWAEKEWREEREQNQQQTKGKKFEINEQSVRIKLRMKKVCWLVKFSRFLNLPIEKLNFSKPNQFSPKKKLS